MEKERKEKKKKKLIIFLINLKMSNQKIESITKSVKTSKLSLYGNFSGIAKT